MAMTELELAAGLRVDLTVLLARPSAREIQYRLGALVDVFERASELKPDALSAADFMKTTPIQVLNNRTLLEAVGDNDSEKALHYLQTISGGGQNG